MIVFACCLIAADASLLLAGLIGIVYILHAKGYEGEYPQIVKELVEIIRLRGLCDKPDRRYDPTISW